MADATGASQTTTSAPMNFRLAPGGLDYNWFFGEFRGTGQSFPGHPCRRLAGWTHVPRTMAVFWASTTPGESMLLTFGSKSGESKSA